MTVLMVACASLAILTTIGIVASLLYEALRFFARVPITEFLFGTKWDPQIAIRADQVGGSGAFGALPVFAGTILIAVIAMAVAIPIGLLSAIYLNQYASDGFRQHRQADPGDPRRHPDRRSTASSPSSSWRRRCATASVGLPMAAAAGSTCRGARSSSRRTRPSRRGR